MSNLYLSSPWIWAIWRVAAGSVSTQVLCWGHESLMPRILIIMPLEEVCKACQLMSLKLQCFIAIWGSLRNWPNNLGWWITSKPMYRAQHITVLSRFGRRTLIPAGKCISHPWDWLRLLSKPPLHLILTTIKAHRQRRGVFCVPEFSIDSFNRTNIELTLHPHYVLSNR